jgi:hypothetical protein
MRTAGDRCNAGLRRKVFRRRRTNNYGTGSPQQKARREGALIMNLFANIWNHPKTSAAGLLIAMVTIAGVLSQQGISLGKAGAGTVVSLVSALATALLGLLAKDPEAGSQSAAMDRAASTNAKLGAWMLIALLIPLPWMQGCSATGVAQDIVNWTPALQSAVATVDSTASLLAPADAPIFGAATDGFDAASNLLVAQAKAYLANPTASALQLLQTQVVTFQQQVSSALLQAARIVDANSQQHAVTVIQAVATIVNTILSLVASVSSKAAVAKMSAQTGIKLAMLRPYLNDTRAAELVAAHYNEPLTVARMQVARAEQAEINAGF